MTEPDQQRVRELEEELRILRAENEVLTNEAEQVVLLGSVAEAILLSADSRTLIQHLLERLSILDDVPYCALWTPTDGSSGFVHEYAAFADQTGALLTIGETYSTPPEFARSCAAAAGATSISPSALSMARASFTPTGVAVLPFDSIEYPAALLLFADDRRTPDELIAVVTATTTVVELARTRLDMLAANRLLAVTNADLEREVGERTRQLAELKTTLQLEAEQRRHFEVALKRVDAAFESSHQGVIITDETQRILSVNRAFCDITGYSAEEVIGSTPRLLRSNRHDSDFYKEMWETLAAQSRWEGEIWNRRKDGQIYPEHLNITAVRDEGGEISHYVGVFSDISALKASEAELQRLLHHHRLTGLPNQLLFEARLVRACERALREGNMVAVAVIGVDQFKSVNATFGTDVGDEVLREIARRLRGSVAERHTVAHLPGDEYALLIEDVEGLDYAAMVVQTALDATAAPMSADPHELFVTCSAGIAMIPSDGTEPVSLLRNAHAACLRAKQSGRGSIRFSTSDRSERGADFLVESELRRALRRNEIVVYYQPVFNLTDISFAGVEALARWQHPQRGLLLPDSFVPVAEESGLIEPLGTWVLAEACLQAAAWLKEGVPPFYLAVNVSARQLRPSLLHAVDAALAASGLPAEQLELEITEGSLAQHAEEAVRTLSMLKQRGVRLAIDDFGTGYSSMSYLRNFPIDTLKIDRTFVKDLPHSSKDNAIARTIITLAHGLGLTVVAEGVETAEQANYLRRHECDLVQGYLYGRPVPASHIAPSGV